MFIGRSSIAPSFIRSSGACLTISGAFQHKSAAISAAFSGSTFIRSFKSSYIPLYMSVDPTATAVSADFKAWSIVDADSIAGSIVATVCS